MATPELGTFNKIRNQGSFLTVAGQEDRARERMSLTKTKSLNSLRSLFVTHKNGSPLNLEFLFHFSMTGASSLCLSGVKIAGDGRDKLGIWD